MVVLCFLNDCHNFWLLMLSFKTSKCFRFFKKGETLIGTVGTKTSSSVQNLNLKLNRSSVFFCEHLKNLCTYNRKIYKRNEVNLIYYELNQLCLYCVAGQILHTHLFSNPSDRTSLLMITVLFLPLIIHPIMSSQ